MFQANTIKEYLQILERYSEYKVFYRGQKREYPSIESAVARTQGYLVHESDIVHETRILIPSEFDGLRTPLEYLSKMQHYDIPTRLIDISVNPLIALYFAVEEVDERDSGIVYVFLEPSCELCDIRVKLLSLMAFLKDYDIETIQEEFYKNYSMNITKDEIMNNCQNSVFIHYSDLLSKSNSRLEKQNGTFFICGNIIEGEKILHQLRSLDEITQLMAIKIPFEYKEKIKKSLQKEHQIMATSIYPELPSAAKYIRDKYELKENLFLPQGQYVVVDKGTPRFNLDKLFIEIVLSKPLTIEEIKQVVIYETKQNRSLYSVIRVDIAKTEKDSILNNWILQSEWIRPDSSVKILDFKPDDKDDDGYYWHFESQYETSATYNDEYLFDNDKDLFIYHDKIYHQILPIFLQIQKKACATPIDNLYQEIESYEKVVSGAFDKLNDLGFSSDRKFNQFLNQFLNFVTSIDIIFLFLKKDNLTPDQIKRDIFQEIENANKVQQIIEEELTKWREKKKISDQDYIDKDPYQFKKKEYSYKQTLPISPNARIIEFKEKIKILDDGKIIIYGETNLFDDAELMITIRGLSKDYCGQGKSRIINGEFSFGPFSNNGEGLSPGIYIGNMSLSFPDLQSKSFLLNAGIEYEKIDGPFIKRDGVSPSLSYDFQFEI